MLGVDFLTLSDLVGKSVIELDFSCRFQICMIQGHARSNSRSLGPNFNFFLDWVGKNIIQLDISNRWWISVGDVRWKILGDSQERHQVTRWGTFSYFIIGCLAREAPLNFFHIFSHQTHHLRPVFRVEPCSDWMNNVHEK